MCLQAVAAASAGEGNDAGKEGPGGGGGGGKESVRARLANGSHLELSVQKSTGELVDLLVGVVPRRRYSDQDAVGALLIAQDITERKTLEMVTRVCLAAKAASSAKTEQLSFLCHEIRDPLNGVIGYITFLEETRMNEEQQDLVHTTQQCCLQLRRIVSDVLDLSSIEQGNLEIEYVPFSVPDLVNTVMSQVRLVMEEKGLKMKVDINAQFAHTKLLGDPARIMQILSNFAWNACKFTLVGSVTFLVKFASQGAGFSRPSSRDKRFPKDVEFHVIDTGPGIPHSVQGNLFQPFVQGDKSTTRHHGGTGLGLSICRQLAKLMGGDVRCVSEVFRMCFLCRMCCVYI
jgi:signal transduction histidine kinase